jgi:uncharacterized protein
MHWTWDENKNQTNQRKHGLDFTLAQLVFDDALALSRLDDFVNEERWQTVGRVGTVTLFVVHTAPDGNESAGRIISARKATAHERRAYEEGRF